MLSALARLLPPETAHDLAVPFLAHGLLPPLGQVRSSRLHSQVLGLDLPHPIGLAAGFDKNAEAHPGLFRAGFAFVEIGTVTPEPQAGNPKPRLFRLSEDAAIINRMGFNSDGLEAVAARLTKRRPKGVIGINLGKNKASADATADYLSGLERLYAFADYIAINVSSPNTPGLRDLQRRDQLDALLAAIMAKRNALAAGGTPKPVLLKVAPDLDDADEHDIADVAKAQAVDGLIISNTTLARPDSLRGAAKEEAGGLSGAPLYAASTAQLGRFYRLTGGGMPLIGVGGVASAEQAYGKIRHGASLVQIYTALIYQGPYVALGIAKGLDRLLERDGFSHVSQVIGIDVRDAPAHSAASAERTSSSSAA
ncbi:MAG: quinone-dependent dihydroorotate dehydrogenase [Geminicoccaceae bacterium]